VEELLVRMKAGETLSSWSQRQADFLSKISSPPLNCLLCLCPPDEEDTEWMLVCETEEGEAFVPYAAIEIVSGMLMEEEKVDVLRIRSGTGRAARACLVHVANKIGANILSRDSHLSYHANVREGTVFWRRGRSLVETKQEEMDRTDLGRRVFWLEGGDEGDEETCLSDLLLPFGRDAMRRRKLGVAHSLSESRERGSLLLSTCSLRQTNEPEGDSSLILTLVTKRREERGTRKGKARRENVVVRKVWVRTESLVLPSLPSLPPFDDCLRNLLLGVGGSFSRSHVEAAFLVLCEAYAIREGGTIAEQARRRCPTTYTLVHLSNEDGACRLTLIPFQIGFGRRGARRRRRRTVR